MVATGYYLTQILNGFVLGVIFVLIALGLSLIFGLLGVINFAHGDLLLLGTYVAWTVMSATNSMLLAVLLAPVIVAAVGMVIERFTLRPIYDREPTLQFLLTFGLAEVLREGIQVVWGRQSKSFPIPSWGAGSVDLGLISYPRYRLILIAVTAALIAALYVVLERTDIGLIIRAGAHDRTMVNVLGINVSYVYAITFGLGSALAGVAGALIAPVRGVYPLLGVDLLIPSFVVVIIGGLGSLRGSIVGGLIVGQLIVLTGISFPAMSRIVIFVAMALVLLVRPRGLMGEKGVFG
jgi:branched-chain amino acid transport system permease protein